MEIMITNGALVKDIQQEFQREYPYLKIDFFKNAVRKDNYDLPSPVIPAKMLISNIRHDRSEGTINIDGDKSVQELESDFHINFSLLAKVFRLSGGLWIETTLTAHWSLRRQNQEGRQMS